MSIDCGCSIMSREIREKSGRPNSIKVALVSDR
jgi:hypothetical protein